MQKKCYQCYADSLLYPVTLQTAYADPRLSPDFRPNCVVVTAIAFVVIRFCQVFVNLDG